MLFAIVRSDYVNFRLARFDLGNMVQAVWSTAHGRPLEVTDGAGEQMIRLGGHVDPILALLAPLWIVAPSPLTLAAAQVVACALGALPVFWLGRRYLVSERTAALVALAYLASPWLAWTALDAVHPVTLAIPLFLYAIWFLETERFWLFVVCAVLVLATGELMGLPLAALGLWYWRARGHRRMGLGIAVAGFSWTALCLKVIIPAFRGEESAFYERYASVGGSPGGVVRTAFTDPGAIVSALVTVEDVLYLVFLAVPLGAAFLLAPGLAAVALPQLLANVSSDWHTTNDPRHHYIAGAIPFLFAGAVIGLARVPAARRTRAAVAILVLSSFCTAIFGPWPGGPGASAGRFHQTLPRAHVEALRAAVAMVPEGAPVAAANAAGSQLSARRYFYSLPVVEARVQWIVLDTWNSWTPPSGSRTEGAHPQLLRAFLNRILASPRWRQVLERDGVFVFERVATG
ncbi:MAG: DUF2079 domain-containing protein [Actinobacteria bacterium]|nr:DUF2079 domain-containing protein [Actinomycetota bacterium]